VGILEEKISNIFDIAPVLLLPLTGICLVALATISYINSVRDETPSLPSNSVQQSSHVVSEKVRTSVSLKRFIPKTMIGIIPFGVLFGFIIGLITPKIFTVYGVTVEIPFWDYLPFTTYLSNAEAAGIYIGAITSIILAIFMDSYLGAALAIGFGLGFPFTLVQIDIPAFYYYYAERFENHSVPDTYYAHFVGFLIWGFVLILLGPVLKNIKPILLGVWDILTRPRVN
jgi:hypothetical protein